MIQIEYISKCVLPLYLNDIMPQFKMLNIIHDPGRHKYFVQKLRVCNMKHITDP